MNRKAQAPINPMASIASSSDARAERLWPAARPNPRTSIEAAKASERSSASVRTGTTIVSTARRRSRRRREAWRRRSLRARSTRWSDSPSCGRALTATMITVPSSWNAPGRLANSLRGLASELAAPMLTTIAASCSPP